MQFWSNYPGRWFRRAVEHLRKNRPLKLSLFGSVVTHYLDAISLQTTSLSLCSLSGSTGHFCIWTVHSCIPYQLYDTQSCIQSWNEWSCLFFNLGRSYAFYMCNSLHSYSCLRLSRQGATCVSQSCLLLTQPHPTIWCTTPSTTLTVHC